MSEIKIKEMNELVNPALAPSDDNLETFYPKTHEKAVVDDDGNTLDSKIESMMEDVDEAIAGCIQDMNSIKSQTISEAGAILNGGAVRADIVQSLTDAQKTQALENQGVVIAQGTDFTNPDATKRAKVPTVGAVLDGLNDGVYDVSKRNPTGGPNSDGKFTLEYILNNANTLIPTSRRHGGMLISFVVSSDNKYVQFRCISDEFTTDTTKWAICGNEVLFEENPEFAYVLTDNKKRVSIGIRPNGDVFFGVGVPSEVKNYILENKQELIALIANKEDKVEGKGLSTNDYTDNDKSIVNIQRLMTAPDWVEVTLDSNKNILEGITTDGKKVINLPIDKLYIKELTAEGVGTPTYKQYLIDNPEWSEITLDKENRIVEGIKTNGEKFIGDSNIKKEIASEDLVKTAYNDKWFNNYPSIFDNTQFKEKYLKREDDITILVIGDSLSAFHNQEPYKNQANRPCQMICHNWVGNMWNYLNDTKIISDRFDSEVNTFTEVGTFEDGYSMFQQPSLPYWTCDAMTNNNKTESGSLTRYSNTEGASVAFTWDLDAQEKLHFIHRKDYRAADNVTIAISGGNGKVLVYDDGTDAWVEANGYQFTQKIAQSTEGSGYSQTLSNWRLKMKKASGATGSVTLTFTASGSGYLFYWGTERWNGNRIIIVNSSRGGREAVYFQDVIKNDIAGRKPDLVLVSCMLINEYGNESTHSHQAQTIVNNFQDLFFGNRDGHTTDLSLKSQSNNWQDFEAIAIIPHIRYEYFSDDDNSTFKTSNFDGNASAYMDEIAPVVWNRVKNMIMDNGVKVVDVGLALKRNILSKGWEYKNAFNKPGMDGVTGVTIDGVHQNVLGSLMWAKHIAPIFDIV